jgi:Lon protease-like protein
MESPAPCLLLFGAAASTPTALPYGTYSPLLTSLAPIMDTAAPSQPSVFHLPDSLPVMVLTDCFLFPGCFLPLFIFEERYRQMLSHALGTTRMFCIGNRLRQRDGCDEIHAYSTAGLIRACKKQDDGTSHVMLYGIQRIRFTDWQQEKPFRIARTEAIKSVVREDAKLLDELKAQALQLLPKPNSESCKSMHLLQTTLEEMTDAEVVCDILSYHFVKRSATLRNLLAEPIVEKRYQTLLSELRQLQQ